LGISRSRDLYAGQFRLTLCSWNSLQLPRIFLEVNSKTKMKVKALEITHKKRLAGQQFQSPSVTGNNILLLFSDPF